VKYAYRLSTLSILGVLLASEMVWADEAVRGEMTQAEYEAYRAHIQSQLENVEIRTPEHSAEAATSSEATPAEPAKAGYGQGYRARQERSERARSMGARHGGVMNHGTGGHRH